MAGQSSKTTTKPRRRVYKKFHIVTAFLLGCCFATAAITVVHFSTLSTLHDVSVVASSSAMVHHPGNVAIAHQQKANNDDPQQLHPVNMNGNMNGNQKQPKLLAANHDSMIHPVAGLDCSEHGGPMERANAKEMVYWRDRPSDNSWTSSFQTSSVSGPRQYLSFEPDGGGWNNIRMSMETVLTMAIAMGRVLVLPPSQKMYLLGGTTFNFADFFPLQELAEEHAGLEIISMEQFLTETMGKIVDPQTQQISFPPLDKKTAWDGDTKGIKTQLAPWIRSIAVMPNWDPFKCIAAFPKSTDPQDAILLQQAFDEILQEDGGKYAKNDAYEAFINKPKPVDAPTKDRLRELIAERKTLCVYDADLQDAQLIHFHGKAKGQESGGRLLVHFYAFLFFQDWKTDLWIKRFVRDHVRYIDNIQCAAARIVDKLRTTYGGHFDSFHIRRGDFQYKTTRVDANVIVERAKDVIEEGRVVYIGTDERDKTFFQPLVEDAGWNILFLDDFLDEVGESIDPHYYGMIDQLVVSRGDRFFGCWFSTFSGYIMRLRGYHSQLEISSSSSNNPNADAFSKGKLPNSYYYALEEHKTKMHDYWPVKKAFYAREFPTSWRQLDVE
jgi:hypothetical protein